MITCDHCKRTVPRENQRIDSRGRDLCPRCLDASTTNQIIIDYVAICEKRGEVLNFTDFIQLWRAATELAETTPEELRPTVLRLIHCDEEEEQ